MVDLEQPVYIDHIILYIGANSMYQTRFNGFDTAWTMAVNAQSLL